MLSMIACAGRTTHRHQADIAPCVQSDSTGWHSAGGSAGHPIVLTAGFVRCCAAR